MKRWEIKTSPPYVSKASLKNIIMFLLAVSDFFMFDTYVFDEFLLKIGIFLFILEV